MYSLPYSEPVGIVIVALAGRQAWKAVSRRAQLACMERFCAWRYSGVGLQLLACQLLAGIQALYPLDTGSGTYWVNVFTRAFGMPHIPVYVTPGTNNSFCFPFTLYHGDELLCYDPTFLSHIATQYGQDAGIGLLAHEVGHGWFGDQVPNWMFDWADERRADYFAGKVLARLNVDPKPFLNLLEDLGYDQQHAYGSIRVADVLLGFHNETRRIP